jgi:UDP-GlcNAc:undecaprenyl-phosphate/decaprenyl-phosphate GlcNAc-1-phosphate transferase
MLLAYTITFIVSLIFAALIFAGKLYDLHHFGNNVHGGKHNLHKYSTPRIGGVAIFIGLLAGLCTLYLLGYSDAKWQLQLLLCAGVVCGAGLIEDLMGVLSPLSRLCIILIASVLAFILIDAKMLDTSIDWVNRWLLDMPWLSFLVTILLVAGMTNANNMIDGLHGLMLFCSAVALASLAICAYLVGDILIYHTSLLVLAASLGVAVFNIPYGKIFAGDSGAYLLGFLLAELALFLAHRNLGISPWCPVLIMIYPISDLLFSMFRRIFIQRTTPGTPDSIHLHSLIYRLLLLRVRDQDKNITNIKASMTVWHVPLISAPLPIYFRQHTLSLVVLSIFFLAYYVFLYWLVTNKAPIHNK